METLNKILNTIKKIWNNQIFRHLLIMGGIFFSFLIIDVYLRYFSNQNMRFYGWARSAPNLFTFSWIFLALGIIYMLPKKAKMITYSILIVLSNVIVYAEYLHYRVLDRFFMFSDILLAGEGKDYFSFAISKTTPTILIVLAISLLAAVVTLFLIKNTEEPKKDKRYYIAIILTTVILVTSCRGIAISKFGKKAPSTTWEAAFYSKNIYLDYNNQNKSMEISGVYELVFRSTYLYIKDSLFSNKKEMINEIDSIYDKKDMSINVPNEYTGILEGKNVIYVLMESIDSWLVTEELMPTLSRLQKEGLNFTNRYASTFGGGQTINTEFAMNTGLYSVSNSKAIYNYDKNLYPFSLANTLKNNGYSAMSIHTNFGSFYNRINFHEALGFEKYNGLLDMDEYKNRNDYISDSELVKTDKTYDLIVREEPFLSYLITYSAHLPYDDTNGICRNNPYGLDVEGNKELSCIRNLARDTDEMLRILIERLEKDNKLDNTVLVLVTDHYAYGFGDQDYVMNSKGVENTNLAQHVPFVIWSNDIKHKNVDTIMDTADILPTLLNMLGVTYIPNYYVGTDVFSENHEKFVYFANDSFYDGKFYYNGYNVTPENEEYVSKIVTTIREKINLNNKIIMSDYFRDLQERSSEE